MASFLNADLFDKLHQLNDYFNEKSLRARNKASHLVDEAADTVQDWANPDDSWGSFFRKAKRNVRHTVDDLGETTNQLTNTVQRGIDSAANRAGIAAGAVGTQLQDTFQLGDQDEADMGNVLKGLAAGILGGLAATAVKTLWEEFAPVREPQEATPPAQLADQANMELRGEHLDEQDTAIAEQAIHWTFGTTTGAVYGLAAEATDAVTTGYGIPFGMLLWAGTHASTVPALGLEDNPLEKDPKYAVNEFAGHLLYGITAEVVRRGVRSVM